MIAEGCADAGEVADVPLRMRSSRARAVSVAVAAALAVGALAACSDGGGERPHAPGASPSNGASSVAPAPSRSPQQDELAKARLAAAHYDYAGAIATLTAHASPAATKELATVRAEQARAVTWPDDSAISHLFYHSLVVDPARAFTEGTQGAGFSQYMVTVSEFTKQLQQIYAHGYVLVHPQDIAARGKDGTMRRLPIVLPPGKKPLVLSIDDVSYYEYMTGRGFASNLVTKPDGHVVNTYVDASGKTTRGNYDVMPIVDDFVRAHPDFSYRGAKGTIGLTGYNGILGYRTSVKSYGDTPTTARERARAKVVADALKAEGWNFASHSWGHINMTTSTRARIKADAGRWDREVRPLVGDTPLLIYPFGADISGVTTYGRKNAKFTFLHDKEKFSYFFNVDGSTTHWMQFGPESVRQARINVDGISLQRALDHRSKVLDPFFDARSTIDPHRPLPVPGSGGPKPGVG